MDKAKELVFQRAIVDDLTADGWLEGKAEQYNRLLNAQPMHPTIQTLVPLLNQANLRFLIHDR